MPPPQPPTPPHLPSLRIRPATRADLPSIARLHADAFNDFEIYDWFLSGRHAHPEQYYRYLLLRDRMLFDSPDFRFTIAEAPRNEVDRAISLKKGSSSGSEGVRATAGRRRVDLEAGNGNDKGQEMVPLAFMCLEAKGESALARRWKAEDSWDAWFDGLAARLERNYVRYVTNRVADYAAFAGLVARFGVSFPGIPGLVHVQFLITGPEYQGLGVGRALLAEALELGRREGLCVGLESSYAGRRMYERTGFKVTMEHVIEEWDGNKNRTTTRTPVMIWEPEDRKGEWLEEDGKGGWRVKGEDSGQLPQTATPVEAGIGET